MKLAIDFDGTVVEHRFPKVGQDVPHAAEVLKLLSETGHQLILFTMRSDRPGKPYLTDAVNWFKERGIQLHGINTDPDQASWTDSPKAHADLCIDDRNIGCPLVYSFSSSEHPYVDWIAIREDLVLRGLIPMLEEWKQNG